MDTPPISLPILRFFRRITRGYFRRHFHSVRMSGAERYVNDGRSLIVYANHSSWWDPMVSILLAELIMPDKSHFAPMDAEALIRYGILQKIGIFAIEVATPRGAAQFLGIGSAILKSGGVLWITPQGRFVDAQVRPLLFKPGLAVLAARTSAIEGACTVLPLAIEYSFWDERLPEVLLRFGCPVQVMSGEAVGFVQDRLVDALDIAMGELRELAVTRDTEAFVTLLQGRIGVGGFYALIKRLKAIVLQQPHQPEHTVAENAKRGKDDA